MDLATQFLLDASTSLETISELFTLTHPSVVYLCGARTWVDGCETDQATCLEVNTNAPSLFARVASASGIKIVFFSTDYVFNGASGPYSETDDACPANVYGSSKLAAERKILDIDSTALVIRTTVVYGPEHVGKNFVYQICSRLSKGKQVNCITDQMSTPTYSRDLAQLVVRLVQNDCRGVYNCAGTEVMSRYEFALIVARELELDEALIAKVTTQELQDDACREGRLMAKRGLKLGLTMDKTLATVTDIQVRTVSTCMKDWLRHPRGKTLV